MSEGFSVDWLALRERADGLARSAMVERTLGRWCRRRPDRSLAVLDLGAGTGANARYLAPRLPGRQHWLLVDHAAELLAEARDRACELRAADGSRVTLDTAQHDLMAIDDLDLAGIDIVTGSALLDLVSAPWLDELAGACAGTGTAAAFFLSYDGRVELQPRELLDGDVVAAFNAHQRAQVRVGPALGPDAAPRAASAFAACGYAVGRGAAPWRLGPRDTALIDGLLAGWRAAASEQVPARAAQFAAWAERRHHGAAAGELAVTVGHVDLFAAPPGSRGGVS